MIPEFLRTGASVYVYDSSTLRGSEMVIADVREKFRDERITEVVYEGKDRDTWLWTHDGSHCAGLAVYESQAAFEAACEAQKRGFKALMLFLELSPEKQEEALATLEQMVAH